MQTNGHLTPEQFAQDQDTVTMIFPNPVLLTVAEGKRVQYPAGTHEVPASIADHWWLKNNGVKLYQQSKLNLQPPGDSGKSESSAPPKRTLDAEQVEFIKSANKTIEEILALDDASFANFLEGFEYYKKSQSQPPAAGQSRVILSSRG